MSRPRHIDDDAMLKTVRRFVASDGYAPTVRTLAERFAVSERTVIRCLRRLESLGHLTRQWPGVRNGLKLAQPRKAR